MLLPKEKNTKAILKNCVEQARRQMAYIELLKNLEQAYTDIEPYGYAP
ncbi:MAG: hypothetical protein IPN43_17030 [Chitinophagaceae bacterium]|nr:hypothetical protein [Chitinophagaceae bacterium]